MPMTNTATNRSSNTPASTNSGIASLRHLMGHQLAGMSPSKIGAVWFETGDGQISVSLRSVGNADVSKIAARYGGGGHKHAAGFRAPSLKRMPWK